MAMQQCENCTEWVEDTYWIEWPVCYGASETEKIYVCQECLDHMKDLAREYDRQNEPVPEYGSPACQPNSH